MPHITPPEPDIKLYDTGFDPKLDLLDRGATGKSLSDLVMRIDDPLVIALDGGWGSGKSFFLKCWVGAHLKDHAETSQTVYFDAFEHDFIDAPLASLMGVLLERLEPAQGDEKKIGATIAKSTIGLLKKTALPLTRLGLAVASYGATEAVGALGDALIKQSAEELETAAKDFWARESGQREAMTQFKEVLKGLTEGDGAPKRVIIVIDELDRCRPDYALSLLEIIKHFFAVPNVHFVLGVNMKQLENSVHARYGAGIDAGLYLQKFVGLTMRLPNDSTRNEENSTNLLYFDQMAAKMGLNESLIEHVRHSLKCLVEKDAVSFRSIERTLTLMALVPVQKTPFEEQYGAFRFVLASLIVVKVHAPDIYVRVSRDDFDLIGLKDTLHLQDNDPREGDRLPYLLFRAWATFLDPDRVGDTDGWRGFAPWQGLRQPRTTLAKLIRDDLETFQPPNRPET